MEAYASCLGYSLEPDKAQTRAAQLKKEGFRYQKWFLAYGPGDGPEGLRKNVELVRMLREAVGEDIELMFDVYSGWDLTYALEWAKQVERYRPRWIEEATQAEKIDSFAQLRKGTSIPIASGEHIQGRWEVYDYLKEGALSVVQCDPEWCGGTTELQKICTVASLFDVPVIPHGHSLHAALHLIASQSPAVCPLAEYLILKMRSYYHFEKAPPVPTQPISPFPPAPATESNWTKPKSKSRNGPLELIRAATERITSPQSPLSPCSQVLTLNFSPLLSGTHPWWDRPSACQSERSSDSLSLFYITSRT